MYRIVLISGAARIDFPILPEEIPITYPADNERYNIIGLGEVVNPQLPPLIKVSWSSYFPSESSPDDYVETIRALKESRRPALLIISRSQTGSTNFAGFTQNSVTVGTSLDVIVEDFDTTEKGGEPGDLYYNITLTEYRHYAAKSIKLEQTASGGAATAAITEPERPKPDSVIAVGSAVTVTGTLYRDSFGAAPGKSLDKYSGAVSLIADGRPYPYHIAAPDGSPLGWVAKKAAVA
jgi:hypothetical protein